MRGDFDVPVITINEDEFDQIYVKVNGKSIWFKDIPEFTYAKIEEILAKNGKPVTAQNVANYWVQMGKPKAFNLKEYQEFSNEKIGSMQ